MRNIVLLACALQASLLLAQAPEKPESWYWYGTALMPDFITTWSPDDVLYSIAPGKDGGYVLTARGAQYERKAEVRKETANDTTYTEDMTTGEMHPVIDYRGTWMPWGACSRRELSTGTVLSGQMHAGVPVGHWEERDAQGRLVRAYDLLEGGLHGSYLEYHPNGRVKWAGQYGAVTDTVSFEDAVTKKPVPIEMHTQGKVGTWEHRDAQGALLERIAYGEPKQ